MAADVLLVEDEFLVREVILDSLHDAGLTVVTAESGAQALEVLRREQASVLVTDINLGPGPNGFDVARHAREMSPTVAVVYVTGHAEHLASERVRDAHMVAKPFLPEVLARQVASLATG